MTNEEKDLLLRDLSARIPYEVKFIDSYGSIYKATSITISKIEGYLDYNSRSYYFEDIKPLLFPLSSMTEEQRKEYQYITERWMYDSSYSISDSIDWLNKHHFDYRGLIPMGLAKDATNLNVY